MTTGNVNASNLPATTLYKMWGGIDDPVEHETINPYDMEYLFMYAPGGWIYVHDAGSWGKRFIRQPGGGFGSRGLPYGSVNDYLRQHAGNKLAEKIRDHKFDLGVALAEARSSLMMIAVTANRLARMLMFLRTRNCATLPKRLRSKLNCTGRWNKAMWDDIDLNSLWLELEFGWRPLLNDIYNAAESAAKILHPQTREKLTVTVSVKTDAQPSGSDGTVGPLYGETLPPGCTWGYYPRVCTESLRFKFALREEAHWSWALGIQDPESIAWELLPYSFVVDWILPIGDWLRRRAMSSTMIVAGSYTRKIRTAYTGRLVFAPNCEYYGDVSFKYRKVNFTRTPISSLDYWLNAPIQMRDWRDVFAGDLGVRRVFDSLALLKQALDPTLSRQPGQSSREPRVRTHYRR